MLGILIMELKGFTKISDELALKMESIKINAERIRAATIEIINNTIYETKKVEDYLSVEQIGGDMRIPMKSSSDSGLKSSTVSNRNHPPVLIEIVHAF